MNRKSSTGCASRRRRRSRCGTVHCSTRARCAAARAAPHRLVEHLHGVDGSASPGRCRRRRRCAATGVGAVAHRADDVLDEVLHRHQARRCGRRGRPPGPGGRRAGAARPAPRRAVRPTGTSGSARIRCGGTAVAGSSIEVEDVLDVQVSGEPPVRAAQREPGEAGAGHHLGDVADGRRAPAASRGRPVATTTSATVASTECRVRVSREDSCWSSRPSRPDSAIRSASSPEVKAASSSSRGSTPIRRSTPLARKLNR